MIHRRLLADKQKKVQQQLIADAARKLIAKQGSGTVTVKRIADEVGICEATIYRHFKNKAAIFSHVLDDLEKNWNRDINNLMTTSGSPAQLLNCLARSQFIEQEQKKGVGFQVIFEIGKLKERKLKNKAKGIIEKCSKDIRRLMKEGMEAGELRKDIDIDIASTQFIYLMQGIANGVNSNFCSAYEVDKHCNCFFSGLKYSLVMAGEALAT